MKLQQLIVESQSPVNYRRNLIVRKSRNVEPELLDEAIKWITIRSGIRSGRNAAIFYRNAESGCGIFGRSYAGGFDSEGNRPLRTHFVIVAPNQLECYYNNPVLIIRSLNSCGAWILKTSKESAELPELELSDHAVNSFAYPYHADQVEKTLNAIKKYQRVAVTDASRPLEFVGEVLQAHSFETRSKISFAIDRRVSADTPFQISAYSSDDIRLKQDLSDHGVYPVRLRSKPVSSI